MLSDDFHVCAVNVRPTFDRQFKRNAVVKIIAFLHSEDMFQTSESFFLDHKFKFRRNKSSD